jgi:hypothetical protein
VCTVRCVVCVFVCLCVCVFVCLCVFFISACDLVE